MSAEERSKPIFPEVRVVEASAGSGKTYALAKRYVQLLINPGLKQDEIPLESVLAITFTNKATIEMKERILEFLKKIALDSFPSKAERDDILSALGVRPEAARQKAFSAMERIVRNYNFFQVQTIDSFVNAIVSGCAFTLDLSSKFAIKEDYKTYLAYSLDALIERARDDGGRRGLFKDFLTQYLHVENRFGWFPRASILSIVEELYRNRNTYGGEFKKLSTAAPGDLFALKSTIIKEARELKDVLPEGTNKTFAKKLNSLAEAGRTTFTLDELSSYFEKEGFPANKGVEIPEEADKIWRALRTNIRSLCRREAESFYNCYIDIFEPVWRDFRDLARREDVLFLQELNRQACDLFARNGISVPEIYYRLAVRFRHFLVDEFQDTSALQWRNLLPLVEDALASGGSLFYVGDKKQAIYRFRGGDASFFDRIPVYFENFKPVREVLSQNYRSHREIVSFNNGIFSGENLRSFIEAFQGEIKDDEERLSPGDVGEILSVFADSRQAHQPAKDGGLVRMRRVEAATVDERNAVMKGTVTRLVKELRKRFVYGDIAILTRGNDDIELVTRWLLEENIPVESEKTLNIREHALIKEIVSLLTFLNSPIDDLAFASFMTGSVFSAATGLSQDTMRDYIFKRNSAGRSGGYLYRDFREDHPDVWNGFIEEYFVNVGYVPLYELLVSILGRFKVMENFPEQHAFVGRLLELIRLREEESSGVGPFLAYFAEASDNDLFVAVSGADAVRLLTVHKAKGLEFPVVILPFLEMKVNPSGQGGLGTFDISQDESGIALTRLSKRYARFSPELRARYIEHFKRSFVDELNVAYVALTRARCEMYGFIPDKAGSGKNPVRFLIPRDVDLGAEAAWPAVKKPGTAVHMELPVPAPQDWIGLLKDEFTGDAHLLNRKNVAWGNFIHHALSCIDNSPDGIDAAIEKAGAAYPLVADAIGAAGALKRLLDDGVLRKLLFTEDGAVFREKEIVTSAGLTRRIDRLVVGRDAVRVIDYKTSRIDGDGYREQVKGYMSLVQALYPDKKVSGHILYIDSLQSEDIS